MYLSPTPPTAISYIKPLKRRPWDEFCYMYGSQARQLGIAMLEITPDALGGDEHVEFSRQYARGESQGRIGSSIHWLTIHEAVLHSKAVEGMRAEGACGSANIHYGSNRGRTAWASFPAFCCGCHVRPSRASSHDGKRRGCPNSSADLRQCKHSLWKQPRPHGVGSVPGVLLRM